MGVINFSPVLIDDSVTFIFLLRSLKNCNINEINLTKGFSRYQVS